MGEGGACGGEQTIQHCYRNKRQHTRDHMDSVTPLAIPEAEDRTMAATITETEGATNAIKQNQNDEIDDFVSNSVA